MRAMNRPTILAALLCAAALGACDENAVQEITGPMPSARVKFHNFGVNAPGMNFYANDTKLTAINSATNTESATGTVYGSAAAGGFYTAIAPGQYTFTGRIAAVTDNGLAVASLPATIADGTHYTLFVSGVYDAAAKTVESFIVEDPIPAITDYTVAYVRFVNASANASPLSLHARFTTPIPNQPITEHAIGGAVAYKSAGAFTAIPEGNYDITARAGNTDVVTRTGLGFVGGRVYTIALRGDVTVSPTGTAVNRPFLDNTANR